MVRLWLTAHKSSTSKLAIALLAQWGTALGDVNCMCVFEGHALHVRGSNRTAHSSSTVAVALLMVKRWWTHGPPQHDVVISFTGYLLAD